MEWIQYKGYRIVLNYSDKYKLWSWDVSVKGESGAGPAKTREKAESDARAFIDACTRPGGPRRDMMGRIII